LPYPLLVNGGKSVTETGDGKPSPYIVGGDRHRGDGKPSPYLLVSGGKWITERGDGKPFPYIVGGVLGNPG
jgi:hypothetical protein